MLLILCKVATRLFEMKWFDRVPNSLFRKFSIILLQLEKKSKQTENGENKNERLFSVKE